MKNEEFLVLSTAYFAPVQYYSLLLSEGDVFIERHENYIKQSYRNRCTIYSANGLLSIVVPVAKSEKAKISVSEIEISYDMNWQKQHFKAIESAYGRSPFYEYYIDDLMIFFNRRYRYLYEFNMEILRSVCNLMNTPFRAHESDAYINAADRGIIDMRNLIHPKIIPENIDKMPHYTQVFANKHGFKANLSILDLLFNTGPEAKKYINKNQR